jgi:hypothetical protein
MSKRFTDTTIWMEDWFLSIPQEYKLFWFYIKDNCDHAGLWKPNKVLFEVMLGSTIDLVRAFDLFNADKERVCITKTGRWLIIDFFKFQYGNNLNILNRVHKSIKLMYEKEGVNLRSNWGQDEVNLRSIRGQDDPNDGAKDKDKDKDIYIDLNKEKEKETLKEILIKEKLSGDNRSVGIYENKIAVVLMDEFQKIDARFDAINNRQYHQRLNKLTENFPDLDKNFVMGIFKHYLGSTGTKHYGGWLSYLEACLNNKSAEKIIVKKSNDIESNIKALNDYAQTRKELGLNE